MNVGPKSRDSVLREVDKALDGYRAEVRTVGLKPSAQEAYILQREHFVRWLKDDFEPGVRKYSAAPRF